MSEGLTYSEVVYLLADKFLSERSSLVNFDHHPTGQKISCKPLAAKMILAALVYLLENNYIDIYTKDVKKMLFFSGQDVFIKTKNPLSPDINGIERKIYQNIDSTNISINNTVYHLINSDDTSPWGVVINMVKPILVDKNYLIPDQKKIFSAQSYSFNQSKLANITPLFDQINQALNKFESNKQIFDLTQKAIVSGLKSRQEHEGVDLDN